MNIIIVSATSFEIAPLLQYLENNAEQKSFIDFQLKGKTIYPLVTGVGALNTSFGMARHKNMEDIDVLINVGLAGSYSNVYQPGEVVEVIKDRFADLGVEEADGSFTDVFDLGLIKDQSYPYENGWIKNTKQKLNCKLPEVTGLTVNKVSGTLHSIENIRSKYKADIETMEGAGFLYACKMMDAHCHQIRAISNRVEPRNKDNWAINDAIDNLNLALIRILEEI